jgi:GT2 family glycosyltransferase
MKGRRTHEEDDQGMRLAVLDFDMLDLPREIAHAGEYDGAVVLLRIGGRPCGQAVLSFDNWEPSTPLFDRLSDAADSAFWENWLAYKLGLEERLPAVPPRAVDVVICTRDRPDDLEKCLNDLLAMPDDGQGILVVDNASATDATRKVVEQFPGVRYVREDRPGLDIARNRGIAETSREIIAFIDDDAAPDRLWLRNLTRNFEDPLVVASGGLTMAMELQHPAQIAFQRVGGFGRGFKRIVYDATNCDPYHAWYAGAGVNMALRRSVFADVGLFDEALDAGTQSLAGGDTDMFRRIIKHGWQIVYDPEALNWHRHRRSMAELQRQIFGYEVAAFAILTKSLRFEHDWSGLGFLLYWARQRGGALLNWLRYGASLPFNVPLTQIRGGLSGPRRYATARRRLRDGF